MLTGAYLAAAAKRACRSLVLLCLAGQGCSAAPPPDDACLPRKYDDRARVKFVIDGDTIILADSTRVRLLGVDTPEMGRDGAPDQPGAREATRFLRQLLPQRSLVRLKYDPRRLDRYGRTLAHLFADGKNAQKLLLERGLAVPRTIPPNLSFLACYQQASREAAAEQRGLWARPQYQTQAAARLPADARGYRVVRGRVSRVKESRGSWSLHLGPTLVLRIARKDAPYFAEHNPAALTGAEVTARGKVYRRQEGLRIRLRHGSDLIVEKPASP